MTRSIGQETVVTDKTAFILTDLKRRGPPCDGGATWGKHQVGQREGWGDSEPERVLWFSQEGGSDRVSRFRVGLFP